VISELSPLALLNSGDKPWLRETQHVQNDTEHGSREVL
jgi:hypothetical protein